MNLAASVLAAVLASSGAAHAAEAFKPVRSDETYAYLATADRTGLDVLRYIPVGGDAYLTLGGEARLRIDAIDAPRFGVAGEQADTYGLVRGLFSADLHLNDRVRVYGELGWHRDVDKTDAPALTDRDGLDAQVAFVDVTPDADRRWRLRLGRQELHAQSHPALRLGARGTQHPPELRRAAGHPPDRTTCGWTPSSSRRSRSRSGAFDDPSNRDQRFYGVYAANASGRGSASMSTPLSLIATGARFGAVTGRGAPQEPGRAPGRVRSAPADFEAEGMIQRGAFAGRQIRAWGGSVGGGYTLAAPWKPRIGLRLDAGSGDKDPNDGRLQTFNPLFPKGSYFNESSLTSWSNLVAIRPSLGLSPTKAISVEVSYLDRARQTGGDAVYLQPSVVLPGSLTSRAKAVGHALQADASWQATRNVKLQVEVLHQEVDAAVKAAGGRDGREERPI
jgi:hypothetical protein